MIDVRASRRTGPVVALATVLAAVGCGGGGGGGGAGGGAVEDFISGVRVVGIDAPAAQLLDGAAPAANDGPAVAVDDTAFVFDEESVLVVVGLVTPTSQPGILTFDRVFVTLGGSSAGGFYELALPQPVSSAALEISLAQSPPVDAFGVAISVADADERVGQPSTTSVEVVDVRVIVDWDNPVDIDLHVVDPSGEEIFWDNQVAASGGRLLADSAAACTIEGRNSEQIGWPTGQAPQGTYVVRIDHFSACVGVTEANYAVTIQRQGETTLTFNGSVNGLGDRGGLGAGEEVTRFEF